MGKKPGYKKRKKKNICQMLVDVPVWVCVYFIVIGVFLGYIFTNVPWREGKMIDKSETIPVTATFDSYAEIVSGKGSLSEIVMHFGDREKLFIDGACVDRGVGEALERLQPGDKLEMLLHPNSENIWELRSGSEVILAFEDAKEDIRTENIFFTVIGGGVGYMVAIYGAISLALQWWEYKKQKAKK